MEQCYITLTINGKVHRRKATEKKGKTTRKQKEKSLLGSGQPLPEHADIPVWIKVTYGDGN
ncbi:hypothetical protein E2C01_069955 [Portunus trituberculatus]|uniref:Uncharacterized protein n=1 Tax=Portunus trituberculatus TaxID=210409 RepID=A0A5B7I0B8_PORTR|nr:hypothetical protein [Portunus trituberculatus]